MSVSLDLLEDMAKAGIVPAAEGSYSHICTPADLELLVAFQIERYKKNMTNEELRSIELYQMQMAGISTASFGGWKEGDEINPEYHTPALADVANLYLSYRDAKGVLTSAADTFAIISTFKTDKT